jgi:hypothetical protein
MSTEIQPCREGVPVTPTTWNVLNLLQRSSAVITDNHETKGVRTQANEGTRWASNRHAMWRKLGLQPAQVCTPKLSTTSQGLHQQNTKP